MSAPTRANYTEPEYLPTLGMCAPDGTTEPSHHRVGHFSLILAARVARLVAYPRSIVTASKPAGVWMVCVKRRQGFG
jgi:hypothetical protein